MSTQHRAIKYRIYPTDEQANLFVRTFGCCRFVYNQMLDVQNSRYKNGESHLSKFEANNYCTQNLKSKYDFLKEVDALAVMNASFALSDAFARFFKLLGRYPRHKSKHKSKKSYTTNFTNNSIRILDNAIKLPKAGVVKAKLHRLPKDDWKLKSATVSLSGCGKFYVSVLFEYEQDITPIKVNEVYMSNIDMPVLRAA